MVLRRMFQMVFEDKTPKDKVGMGWGKNANMQGVFLGIYDLNFLIRLLQQNVGLLACTDWSMGPFLISISNQAMAAKLHHIQSSMKNSLIGDLDQKYGLSRPFQLRPIMNQDNVAPNQIVQFRLWKSEISPYTGTTVESLARPKARDFCNFHICYAL